MASPGNRPQNRMILLQRGFSVRVPLLAKTTAHSVKYKKLSRVGRAMVSQCTKYEVSRFTRYEAMNGSAKCRKWGGLGWLGGTQGQRQCHHSIERIRLPIRL